MNDEERAKVRATIIAIFKTAHFNTDPMDAIVNYIADREERLRGEK